MELFNELFLLLISILCEILVIPFYLRTAINQLSPRIFEIMKSYFKKEVTKKNNEYILKTIYETFDKNRNTKYNTDSESVHTMKSFDNMILDQKNYNEVIKDFKKFIKNEEYYENYGLPYKRNYYLYGIPGTGKTSIVKILGKKYNYSIYQTAYSHFENENILKHLPNKHAIVIIDEFKHSQTTNIKKRNLLCYLDGIKEKFNLIVFICSNEMDFHKSSKYEALFREGRIDVISFFDYCTKPQAEKMIKFFYGEDVEIKKMIQFFPSKIPNYLVKEKI